MNTVCQYLRTSLHSAAVYNPDVQVAPACILWPDRDRQWESIIPRLQNELAEYTEKTIAAGTIEDICAMYCNFGWKADNAVLKALSCINNKDIGEAVFTAIRSVYLPWKEQSARYFQKITDQSSYPGGTCQNQKTETYKKGECILFIDGLRFDSAKRLMGELSRKGYTIEEKPVWSALPTLTSTCKPAVSPVKELITGDEVNTVRSGSIGTPPPLTLALWHP